MPLKLFGSKKPISRVIGIAAGKGGVGKSTLTVNLALALKSLGAKVGILDADLYGPSIRKMLPEDTPPLQKGEKIVPALCEGIEVISMAFFKSQNSASVIRAPIANKLIAQFLNQVEWGDLDYLLIDFPPGTGDIQITLSQQAGLTGALVITTPQEVALLDVRKCIDMFAQVKIPLLGIVENMSYYLEPHTQEKIFLFGKGGGKKLSSEYGVPFLGQIPVHPLFSECSDLGTSLFRASNPLLIECFTSLASHFIQALESFEKEGMKDKIAIRSMKQKNETEFSIEWTDGSFQDYSLHQLQKNCPCAGCVDKKQSEPNVRATQIRNIGRYAIQVDFTSGCSHGIYDYDFLYAMKNNAETP